MAEAAASGRVRVGIAGLGRSGWGIHAATFRDLQDRYEIVAATDPDPGRRAEAQEKTGCRPCATFEELIARPEVEVVVIATPNHMHGPQAIAAAESGKHIVVEKPFALSTAEADRVIVAGERTGRIIAPFQNRRYEGVYRKLREIIDSGLIGRVVHARVMAHRFSRRWDWQTLKRFGGGELNNTGGHLIDQAVQLFGDTDPQVFCLTDRALTSGDAEDHLKVILYGKGRPTVEVELTHAGAFPQDLWLVMGTSGGIRVTRTAVEWKWVDWSKMPPRPVETQPMPDRSYNADKITWETGRWDEAELGPQPPLSQPYYEDLYRTLREGAPLAITPRSVRTLIAVLEECHRQADA